MERVLKQLFILRLAVFAVCLTAAAVAGAATFTASLDRDAITLGEDATLSLAFEGGQAKNVPTPNVPGLQITQVGTSQSVNIINGAMNSTVTVNFSVTPRQPGEFTIPALTADVNGQQLTTLPLHLSVTRAAAPSAAAVNSGSEIAFLKLNLPPKKIYVGQVFTAQLQIWLRDDVQNFGNFQFTGTPASGFSVGKMNQGQNQRAQLGNRVYTVVPLTFTLTAVQSGPVTVGPFTASMVVVLPSQNPQNGDPFFQMFNRGEQKQVTVATETASLQCLPLPEQNRPPDFNGAVGNYNLAVSVGPTNLAVGDPVTVRVQIAGRGALDSLQLPDQAGWNDFKKFPPTSKVELSDAQGLSGTKTFEQIIAPQNTDVHALPPFSFSFFNPDDDNYHTLTHPAVPLVVRAGGSTTLPASLAGKNATPENQAPPDILPIKQTLGAPVSLAAPLITQPVFLAAQTLPVLAFLAALIWRRRADHLANNPRLRRQRAVALLISSGLNDLKKLAAENRPDEFFALLFRLLQERLGERLDCPATSITESVIEDHAALRRAAPPLREALHDLFQLCNQARYAPVRGSSELNSVATKLEKVLGQLQEVKA